MLVADMKKEVAEIKANAKKRGLTKTVSLKNCGALGKENDFQIPSAQRETAVGSRRTLSMPT